MKRRNQRKTSLPTKAASIHTEPSLQNSNSKLTKLKSGFPDKWKHLKVKYLISCLALCYIITLVVTFNLGAHLIEADDSTRKSNITNSFQHKQQQLPIYYINLDSAVDRRNFMEKQFAALPKNISDTLDLIRVSATTIKDVKSMVKQGTFIPNGYKLVEEKDYNKIEYQFNEVAVTLSHLRSIQMAYNAGYEMALIVEDDTHLDVDFFENWKPYAAQAPRDWKVLQWITSNRAVNVRNVTEANDFWIKWKPYYFSTVGYLIRREGMKNVLDHTIKKISMNGTQIDQWKFDERGLLVADEVVYYYAKQVYTSTFPWLQSRAFKTSFGEGHSDGVSAISLERFSSIPILAKNDNSFSRSEKVAVIMNIYLKDEAAVLKEIQYLKSDIEALSKSNPYSRWFINAIVVDNDMRLFLEDQIKSVRPDMIELRVQVSVTHVNRFAFINEMLKKIVPYDYILLKDQYCHVSGFEWNTFMNVKGESIIASPFYERLEEFLTRYRKDKGQTPVTSQHGRLNTYGEETFANPSTTSTTYLDMFFTLIRVDFASWFFPQILTKEFINQGSHQGPDLMWCGAAYTFNSSNQNIFSTPCGLVNLNLLYDDYDKAFDIDQTTIDRESHEILDILRRNETFARWMEESSSVFMGKGQTLWKVRMQCKRKFKVFEGLCRKKIAEESVNKLKTSRNLPI